LYDEQVLIKSIRIWTSYKAGLTLDPHGPKSHSPNNFECQILAKSSCGPLATFCPQDLHFKSCIHLVTVRRRR